jgi:HPt (histidine-containing phosphotransfer) domain-containing protein
MDIKLLSESVGIDVDTYLVILNVFYEKTVEDIDIIEKALHECKSEQAARGAHSIKGAAGTLALDDICELAKEIEEKARENLLQEILPLVPLLRAKMKPVQEVLQ